MRLDDAMDARIIGADADVFDAFDGRAFTALCAGDIRHRPDAFLSPLVGSNAGRSYLVRASRDRDELEIAIERHRVIAPTTLPALHTAGFLTGAVDDDGRIGRLRAWTETCQAPAQ